MYIYEILENDSLLHSSTEDVFALNTIKTIISILNKNYTINIDDYIIAYSNEDINYGKKNIIIF